MDGFFAIILTSLTIMITQSFSCLESFKRDKKKTPQVIFHIFVSQVHKSIKQYKREPIDHVRSTYSFFVNNLSQSGKGLKLY